MICFISTIMSNTLKFFKYTFEFNFKRWYNILDDKFIFDWFNSLYCTIKDSSGFGVICVQMQAEPIASPVKIHLSSRYKKRKSLMIVLNFISKLNMIISMELFANWLKNEVEMFMIKALLKWHLYPNPLVMNFWENPVMRLIFLMECIISVKKMWKAHGLNTILEIRKYIQLITQ